MYSALNQYYVVLEVAPEFWRDPRAMQTGISNRSIVPKTNSRILNTVRQSLVVRLEHGLHARPCAHLIKTLRPFASELLVEADREQASGHSIMGLMMLAAGPGCHITFTITGPDARAAMAAVEQLFATGFGEAYAPQASPTTRQYL